MRVAFLILSLLSSAHAGVCVATCPCYYVFGDGAAYVQEGEKIRFSNGLKKNNCNQMRISLGNLSRACQKKYGHKNPDDLALELSARQCTLEKAFF